MTPLTNILQRVRSMPMLTVVVLVAVGIIVADGLQMGVWTAVALFIAAAAAALIRREAVAIVVIMAGALTISLRREAEQPLAESQLLKVELLTLAHDLPSRVDFNAKITASFGEKGWQRRATEVRMSAHPALGLQVGRGLLLARGYAPMTRRRVMADICCAWAGSAPSGSTRQRFFDAKDALRRLENDCEQRL